MPCWLSFTAIRQRLKKSSTPSSRASAKSGACRPVIARKLAAQRMLADLRALVEDPDWLGGYEIRTEQKFRYKLGADVEIRGRIDRMDVTPDGGAYVIDYKYSGAQNTNNLGKNGNLLQPQLYLLALERFFELRPEGMSYWGLKGGIQRTPWVPFDPAASHRDRAAYRG